MSKWTSIIIVTSGLAFAACTQEKGPRDLNSEPRGATPAGEPAPNNSGVNQRDRDDAMPTPMDQGQSEVDILITARIRQGLMADERLSLDAKNIKVITLERVVALRGPVASEDEKRRIGQLAEATPQVVKVFNLLEVEAAVTQ